MRDLWHMIIYIHCRCIPLCNLVFTTAELQLQYTYIYIYWHLYMLVFTWSYNLICFTSSEKTPEKKKKTSPVSSSPGRIEGGAGQLEWFPVDGRNLAFTKLRLVVYPIIYKVLYIPGGCLGFLPSKVHMTNSSIRSYKSQCFWFGLEVQMVLFVFFYRNKILGLQIDDSLATFMNEWYTRPTFPWNFMSDKLES